MTFTKEQLIARAETVLSNARTAADFHDSKPYHLMDVHLAEIALASLEAEPVAWLLSGGGAKNHISFDSGNAYADPLREVTPLYTAPPAPVALTSGYSDFEEIWSSSTHPLTQDDEMKDFAWDIWNACRAAMLQGAEPVQGWIPCSERMPDADGNYWGWWSESKRQGPVWFIKSELQAQFQSSEITHWMPLPAAPQHK